MWGLEGAVLAGEVFDLAASGFGIESFYVPFFKGFVGGFDVGLEEVFLADDSPCEIAEFAAGCDRGDEDDHAVFHKNFGGLCDPADVFQAVVIGKSEIGIEAGAQIVPIQDDSETPLLMEDAFRCIGDGGFAGT